jgi:hypothetical protein
MTTYTNITKPSGTSYTNQNGVGKEQYDQSNLEYDDALVFYDGVNESLYTKVTKPSGTSYTNIAKP